MLAMAFVNSFSSALFSGYFVGDDIVLSNPISFDVPKAQVGLSGGVIFSGNPTFTLSGAYPLSSVKIGGGFSLVTTSKVPVYDETGKDTGEYLSAMAYSLRVGLSAPVGSLKVGASLMLEGNSVSSYGVSSMAGGLDFAMLYRKELQKGTLNSLDVVLSLSSLGLDFSSSSLYESKLGLGFSPVFQLPDFSKLYPVIGASYAIGFASFEALAGLGYQRSFQMGFDNLKLDLGLSYKYSPDSSFLGGISGLAFGAKISYMDYAGFFAFEGAGVLGFNVSAGVSMSF